MAKLSTKKLLLYGGGAAAAVLVINQVVKARAVKLKAETEAALAAQKQAEAPKQTLVQTVMADPNVKSWLSTFTGKIEDAAKTLVSKLT